MIHVGVVLALPLVVLFVVVAVFVVVVAMVVVVLFVVVLSVVVAVLWLLWCCNLHSAAFDFFCCW